MKVEKLLYYIGGNVNIIIMDFNTECIDDYLWKGIADDIDFQNIPYGESNIYSITVLDNQLIIILEEE